MKIERFIIEFANYTKKLYKHEQVDKEIAAKAIKRIDQVIKARENGYITPTEAIEQIIKGVSI